jgi:hypothetical protein
MMVPAEFAAFALVLRDAGVIDVDRLSRMLLSRPWDRAELMRCGGDEATRVLVQAAHLLGFRTPAAE